MSIIGYLIEKYKRNKNAVNYWRKKGAKIGEDCEIYPKVSLGSEPYLISIGNKVRIANNVHLITHDGGVWVIRNLNKDNSDVDLFGQIIIGDNVHIGMGATIMPGVKIGDNCIIGCGAIVTKNIPANSVAVGVPARVIETIQDYNLKHAQDFHHTKNLSGNEKKAFLLKQFHFD